MDASIACDGSGDSVPCSMACRFYAPQHIHIHMFILIIILMPIIMLITTTTTIIIVNDNNNNKPSSTSTSNIQHPRLHSTRFSVLPSNVTLMSIGTEWLWGLTITAWTLTGQMASSFKHTSLQLLCKADKGKWLGKQPFWHLKPCVSSVTEDHHPIFLWTEQNLHLWDRVEKSGWVTYHIAGVIKMTLSHGWVTSE